jgi:hypothetical protein
LSPSIVIALDIHKCARFGGTALALGGWTALYCEIIALGIDLPIVGL